MRTVLFLMPLVMLFTGSTRGAEPKSLWTRAAGSDWPGFLGIRGDGSSPEKGILSPWPADGLRIVWHTELGEGYAAPTVVGGRLLQFDRIDDRARLICHHAETGKQLWKFEYDTEYEDYYGYDGGPRCCPVVDGDRVYIHGVEGMLHCLNLTDGKLIWKADTKADYHFHQNFFGVGSTPVIEGDLLLVAVGGSPKGPAPFDLREAKSNGTAIVAFDKLTGKVRYTTGDELASYASPGVFTINGERLGLYFARGGLLGFDPKTGKVRGHYPWRSQSLESVNASNPVVVDDHIFLSECYGHGAVMLRWTGKGFEKVWADDPDERTKTMECHWNTPIHADGYVYGCSGRHTSNAEIRCVEWKTGKMKWAEPRGRQTSRSSLTQINGHFVSLEEYGLMRLLKVNPDKLEEVSSWQVPGLRYPCWASPVVAHGLLYVRGKGRLLCLELIPEKQD